MMTKEEEIEEGKKYSIQTKITLMRQNQPRDGNNNLHL